MIIINQNMFGRVLTTAKYCYTAIKDQINFTSQFQNALIKKLQKKNPDQFLRLEISSGQGCEGYTYKFRFDNKIQKSDYALINNEKIVFAVNEEEMMMLSGSVLDYVSQMMKESFYVKQNPNAELSCSCKTSFSPKDNIR